MNENDVYHFKNLTRIVTIAAATVFTWLAYLAIGVTT